MNFIKTAACAFLLSLSFLSCHNATKPANSIDQRSYQLGVIGGFAELVNAGVKKLALSESLTTQEMDMLIQDATTLAKKHSVELYREKSLISTDLFPEDLSKEKEVLLIYKGITKDAYDKLKADKQLLQSQGKYTGKAREEIARRFGRLLGYSPQGINELLQKNTAYRNLQHFGLQGSNLYFYYKDVEKATDFYTETLGMELVADYGETKIIRLAKNSFLTLTGFASSLHDVNDPKTVAIALLTTQLAEWNAYLKQKSVPFKYEYKPREGGPHDGFVISDPEGYLLEFETFKQHPENETLVTLLEKTPVVEASKNSRIQGALGINATITWLYYKDLQRMETFFQEVYGMPLITDQGWAKIYHVIGGSYLGLVDERRGMHKYSEKKAVSVAFILADPEKWLGYNKANNVFTSTDKHLVTDKAFHVNKFTGADPEKYMLQFESYIPGNENKKLIQYLKN